MKSLLKLTLLSTFILCLAAISNAQDKATISPEQEKLIGELIKVMKVDTQIVEITDEMLDSMEKTYPIIVAGIIEKDELLNDADKSKLSKEMISRYDTFSKKFRKRLPEKVNYPQYIKDTMYPLYAKFFTEKELADLIAFYKTETGQKVVLTMPKLLNESNKLAQQFLLPKFLELVNEIIKEETEELKESVGQVH